MADGGGSLFQKELVVDLFAGGGGASLGISRAYRHPDVAVNHNPIAIAVHQVNHPETAHYVADVFEVEPTAATGGQPVAVLWASPDCRHHSKAKGGKPRSKKIRGLAWVVTKWAAAVRPRIICLENVEEFADWGPLLANGQPCPARKGMTFKRWKKQLENLGYVVEHRELVAADYGAPTIRKRLYLIARCDGRPIVWPQPTHAKIGSEAERTGRLKPWRAAAECIDFNLPAQSIFGRKKALADNTQRRIAKGLWRYVLAAQNPFIVPTQGHSDANRDSDWRPTARHHADGRPDARDDDSRELPAALVDGNRHPSFARNGNQGDLHACVDPGKRGEESGAVGLPCRETGSVLSPLSPVIVGCGGRMGQSPPRSVTDPFQTITAKADACVTGAVLAPFLTEHANSSAQRVFSAQEPLRTQVAQIKGGHFALTAASLVKLRRNCNGADIEQPLGTITAGAEHHALVAAHITKFRTGSVGHGMDEPMHTVVAGSFIKRPGGGNSGMGMVAAHLTHLTHHGDRSGNTADEPLRTVTGANRGEQALVSAFFEQANGGFYDGDGRDAADPLSTICASGSNQRLVQAYFVKYYSTGGQWQGCDEPLHTAPAKDRMGLVQVHQVDASAIPADMLARAGQVAAFLHRWLPEHFPEPAELVIMDGYVLVDITLRMLAPPELARAQGFPDDYVLDRGADGKPITKTDQVRLIGNSVCPDMAEAIVRANAADLIQLYRAAA